MDSALQLPSCFDPGLCITGCRGCQGYVPLQRTDCPISTIQRTSGCSSNQPRAITPVRLTIVNFGNIRFIGLYPARTGPMMNVSLFLDCVRIPQGTGYAMRERRALGLRIASWLRLLRGSRSKFYSGNSYFSRHVAVLANFSRILK
jgi:hypothetical protein